jgi:hypothetical protein
MNDNESRESFADASTEEKAVTNEHIRDERNRENVAPGFDETVNCRSSNKYEIN